MPFQAPCRYLGELTEPYELSVGESLRIVLRLYAGSQSLVGVSPANWTVTSPIDIYAWLLTQNS
jgi:hypothetical protein